MQVAQLALQLYTVRDALESAPERTLTGLSSMGYRNVELAGTAGLGARAFRELLDAHDLAVVGAHVGLDRLGDGFDATLDDLETLGCRYAIVPWLPPERRGGRDVGRWLGETLNGLAERASTRGIRIGYHNHDFEFAGSPVTGSGTGCWRRWAVGAPRARRVLGAGRGRGSGGADLVVARGASGRCISRMSTPTCGRRGSRVQA